MSQALETMKAGGCDVSFARHDVVEDFGSVDLGDTRLNERLQQIAESISRAPGASLPAIFRDESQSEAVYRFIKNERVAPESIVEAHSKETVARAANHRRVLVLHDTTTFTFGGGEKEGMGVIDPGHNPGFYCHLSFCVSPAGEPLGVLRAYAWTRTEKVSGKIPQSISQYLPDRESLRWIEGVTEVNDQLLYTTPESTPVSAIHIMDREADFIEMLAELHAGEISYVIRAKNDRRLHPGREATANKLFAAVENAPLLVHIEVPIIRRRRSKSKEAVSNPQRKGGRERKAPRTWCEMRTAQLEIRVAQRTIFGGNGHHAHVPESGIPTNIVSVQEIDVPDGMEPVGWYLLTDQPIDTAENAVAVVDFYKRRWLIEEHFKALKTGCGYENHHFDTADRYLRMLAIYLPIAVQMLRARWYDRFRPDDPATLVLDEDQVEALRAFLWTERKTLSANPTIGEALKVIARLGGHLTSNGPPGWIVLERGFTTLNELTLGYRAARAWMNRSSPDLSTDESDT